MWMSRGCWMMWFWSSEESFGLEIKVPESLPCRWHLSERVNEVTPGKSRRKALGLSLGPPKFVHKLGAKEPKKNH